MKDQIDEALISLTFLTTNHLVGDRSSKAKSSTYRVRPLKQLIIDRNWLARQQRARKRHERHRDSESELGFGCLSKLFSSRARLFEKMSLKQMILDMSRSPDAPTKLPESEKAAILERVDRAEASEEATLMEEASPTLETQGQKLF
ncbi:hypothetical protein Q3G72_004651 [Acer saccharum]|nr:hypothetical protein Q3G72_004651 [Acer saccharum]